MGVHSCRIPADPVSMDILDALAAEGAVTVDHRAVVDDELLLALSDEEVALLEVAGIPVEVGEDLLANAAVVKTQSAPASGLIASPVDALTTGFITGYLDTAGIYARFDALQSEFLGLTEWTDLPEASAGYDGTETSALGPAPVKLFRIRTPGPTKPGVLLITGTHAREWVPPLGAIEFAEQLLRNYDPASSDPDVIAVTALVEGLDVFIVPALNPDGIFWSFHDYSMWRKNRRAAPVGGCPGTDLNRNFIVYWGQNGSSSNSCHDTHRGPFAFSEPETRNIRYLCETYPNIVIAVDCHSYGEVIFRPQPSGGTYTASEPVDPWDDAILAQLEVAINAGVASVSPSKSYGTGTTSNHAGTSDEYLFFAHRIFTFDLECAMAFQPPVADALVSAAEVAAAMRALGAEALDLASAFTAPASVVQVLDRSGSMVSWGYVGDTRANARRLVDMLSPNDSVGIVSFADDAIEEYSLTTLDPGVAGVARAAVDGIVFGGWTSIGAGLEMAGSMLSGAATPRSIVLLSDGYHNRPPDVATALSGLPSDVRVYTIALGTASDTTLLSSIASDTGGRFYFTPDELALHEIYNYVRADLTTDSLVMNESFEAGDAPPSDDPEPDTEREFLVDADAWELVVTLSWDNPTAEVQVELQPPNGGRGARILQNRSATYYVGRLRRPKAGTWRMLVRSSWPVRCTAAAFVKSDIRLDLPSVLAPGRPVRASVIEGKTKLPILAARAKLWRPAGGYRALERLLPKLGGSRKEAHQRIKSLKADPQGLRTLRDELAARPGGDPFRYRTADLVVSKIVRHRDLVAAAPPKRLGPSTVRVRIEGISRRTGRPFVRVGAVSGS